MACHIDPAPPQGSQDAAPASPPLHRKHGVARSLLDPPRSPLLFRWIKDKDRVPALLASALAPNAAPTLPRFHVGPWPRPTCAVPAHHVVNGMGNLRV